MFTSVDPSRLTPTTRSPTFLLSAYARHHATQSRLRSATGPPLHPARTKAATTSSGSAFATWTETYDP